ncbi:MAG: hypothetical protein HGB03_00625 [Candidatus Yonathbacteria bacterium]|nr:hypothetical protein [Candidatus Yonathbacteria bacterium]NTW47766.1 hypothetical protein [Candidatus Yonathbacteria bacterium]
MLVSYNWLKNYLGDSAPTPEKIAELLTHGAFEIEEMRTEGNDTLIDVDVLPNRAHDCLCHKGIACEIAHLANIPFIKKSGESVPVTSDKTISIAVEDTVACKRYSVRVIENVTVTDSPAWLKERLTAIGQRSINTVVDANNYTMYDMGQPLHAFDMDKLAGGIVVRRAKDGESLTTLDNKQVILSSEDLTMSDGEGLLAIAGIKGGKKAEVDAQTTTIVIESANFLGSAVRKTSVRTGIKTDSGKRFENGLTPEIAHEAMEQVTALILELSPGAKAGEIVDVYPKRPAPYQCGFALPHVNKLLGTALSQDEITHILTQLELPYSVVEHPRAHIGGRAKTCLHTPHKIGASITYDAPQAFDCSSLIAYLYADAGMQIPRMTVDQYVFGEEITKEQLQEGDVVFFNSQDGNIFYETKEYFPGVSVPEGVDHCGLYIGNEQIIHSSRKNGRVAQESMQTMSETYTIVGYRRMPHIDETHVAVTVPAERLDIRIAEDLIEEIGRVYGYDKIAPKEPFVLHSPTVLPIYYVSNAVRSVLNKNGCSEIYTSSFRNVGDIEVLYPAASDKNFLRTDLATSMMDRLAFNARNMDLFGMDHIVMFEIGSVFTKAKGEQVLLCIGAMYPQMKEGKAKETAKGYMTEMMNSLSSALGIEGVVFFSEQETEKGYVVEIDLGALSSEVTIPDTYGDVLLTSDTMPLYKPFSVYPFMTRDIAFWTPAGTSADEAREVVVGEGHPLIIRTDMFDTFEKDERVSYAFRIVFQAVDRTLTDEEVNAVMEGVYARVGEKGWEGR